MRAQNRVPTRGQVKIPGTNPCTLRLPVRDLLGSVTHEQIGRRFNGLLNADGKVPGLLLLVDRFDEGRRAPIKQRQKGLHTVGVGRNLNHGTRGEARLETDGVLTLGYRTNTVTPRLYISVTGKDRNLMTADLVNGGSRNRIIQARHDLIGLSRGALTGGVHIVTGTARTLTFILRLGRGPLEDQDGSRRLIVIHGMLRRKYRDLLDLKSLRHICTHGGKAYKEEKAVLTSVVLFKLVGRTVRTHRNSLVRPINVSWTDLTGLQRLLRVTQVRPFLGFKKRTIRVPGVALGLLPQGPNLGHLRFNIVTLDVIPSLNVLITSTRGLILILSQEVNVIRAMIGVTFLGGRSPIDDVRNLRMRNHILRKDA